MYPKCRLRKHNAAGLYAFDKKTQSPGVTPRWPPFIHVRSADGIAKKASQGGGKVLIGRPHRRGAPYRVVFYPSGSLRIQAYLYVPGGQGPFPTVIYNHGSRLGRERMPVAQGYICKWLRRGWLCCICP